jgi:plasmid stabilization system protein ParE
MRILWFERALKDLDAIYNFRAVESEKSAVKLYNEILDRAESLLQQPLMGAVEPYLNDGRAIYRFLLVEKTYKIIYRADIDNAEIYILMIWDCRQNPEKMRE